MSEFVVMTMPEIEALAKKKMCVVVVAHDNQLQFDLDDTISRERCVDFVERLNHHYGQGLQSESWTSKSGNLHRVVTLPESLPVESRIAMQAMGGSDYGREFAALNCHRKGSPHPVLLFRPTTTK